MPAQFFIIPLFFMWKQMGLVNSRAGLIIIYVALFSPFATYLIRSYMISIPEEFVEAARIDGASIGRFSADHRPADMAGFPDGRLVVGLGVWNEFLFAVTSCIVPSSSPFRPASMPSSCVSGAIGG